MASNLLYFKITRELLQNYFGSAFRELGSVFIVITIRTKFPDSKEMSFIKIYIIIKGEFRGWYKGAQEACW